MKKIYVKENKDIALLDPFLVHMVVGTIVGARLGEVFFYNWDYFQNNLLEIFLPFKIDSSGWEFIGFRGLSSHGATVGIIISIILYKIRYKYDSVLWIFDRIVIAVALGGMFVRIGNFFNSEIVGKYTNSDFGVIFLNRSEVLPRHPAQLYEAFGYLLLFILLLFSWVSLVGVVRAEFLRARNFEYVLAARALGVSNMKIMFNHLLPNAMVATLTFLPFILNGSIVTLTSLDFLGFGMPPGSPSLGELLAQGKNNIHAPWLGLTSFFGIAVLLSLLIFIGEGVRDAFDPRKVFVD